MYTIHNFVDKYPIASNSEKLILGTIHPHEVDAFNVPFFYGNKLSLWKIFSEAFPDELKAPITLDGIINFLDSCHIGISDTILECKRTTKSALDKDLIPTKLNHSLKHQIKESAIKEILFTSGFGKNNAFRLFYEGILGLKIDSEIKAQKEITLPAHIFGRSIVCKVLVSPSGAANISLSTSVGYLQNKHKFIGSKRPVKDYKVEYYKNKFIHNND